MVTAAKMSSLSVWLRNELLILVRKLMKSKSIKYILLCCMMLCCISAFAAPSPLPMLQSTSDQMLSALRSNQAVLKSKPAVVYSITRRILLPHVDVNNMARAVLGRNAWNQATPAQRQHFTAEFTTLLIHTYAAAFAAYTDEQVQFLPIRGDISGLTRVQVDSQIIRRAGPSISVSYRLGWTGQQWLLYDFSVDGVSMIQSFRSQFSSQLNQGNLDTLIQQLAQHNAQR